MLRVFSMAFFAMFAVFFSTFPAIAGDEMVSFREWRNLGPAGGDVRAIEVDPRNKNHLFLTTMDGQIYGSFDAGSSWELLANLHEPQLVLDDLIIDSRDSDVIYIAGHRFNRPGGFFKSTDGGYTWKEAKELKDESVHAMVQSSKDPDLLLVGTISGVWISRDSGDSWKRFDSKSTPEKLDSLAIDPRNTDVIYAGTWWRAYKTTDGGKNWRLVKDGMIDDSDVFAIDINSENPDHIIASACSGIYESTNAGEKWRKIQGIPSQSRRTRDIVQHPSVPGTVYAGTTEGLWMTINGGRTWRLTTDKDLDINSIAVHPDEPNRVFLGTNNQGVLVSLDRGRTFKPSNGNFSSRFTYNLVPDVEMKNRLYAVTINTAGGGGFVFLSDDYGQTWAPAVKGLDTGKTIPYGVIQDRTNPAVLNLATNLGVYQSSDRGVSWKLLTKPKPVRSRSRRGRAKPAPPTDPDLIPALEGKINALTYREDEEGGYLAGTNEGLYMSRDINKGWKKLPFGEDMSEQVLAVHVNPRMPQVIWVGTARDGVYFSQDNGETWAVVKGVPDKFPISTIASDPVRPERVYVGLIHTIYLSRDYGKSWTRRGGNLPLGNYNTILINPDNTDEVYAASALEQDGGIYYSQDAGWTWERIDDRNSKIGSHRIWSLVFNPSNPSQLLAGTHSSGIFSFERAGGGRFKPVDTAKKSEFSDSNPEALRKKAVASDNR